MFNNNENIDYLAELIVSQLLINKGIDDRNIHIHFLGIFKRFFSNDVEKIEAHKNEKSEKEWNIYVHREGLYDLLPEGFFHGHSHKYYKDQKETIQEFRKHRTEEAHARQFFIPLDQEFFSHLVNKESFEQNFFYAPETIREFIDFFNFDHLGLNMYQQSALFFMLPHIPKIAGNLSLTETCFEIILQEPVNIRTIYDPQIQDGNNNATHLGDIMLAVNSVLGNVYVDQNLSLEIEIGPLQQSAALLYFLGGSYMDLINRLIELFIQADLSSSVKVVLDDQDQAFILGEQEYESRLNYSTTI